MHPFSKEYWWVLGLFPLAFVLFSGIAFILNSKRDVGLGMLSARPGPAKASSGLLSPIGLAWRLQKGTLIGWTVGIAVMGITVGMVAEEFKNLFTENDGAGEFLETIGGTGTFTDILFAAMFSLMAIVIAAYGIQALLRIRSEEASGKVELVVGAAVSKPRWMLSHIACAFGGIVVLSIVFALTTAVSYILIADGQWSLVPKLLEAAFVYIPAILTLASVAIAIFGLLPRAAIAIAWSSLAICLLLAQFGELLKLPAWALNVSPFTHTPTAPTEAITAQPLLILSGIAILLLAIGLASFRRRDLATS
jgi:ABC-2 type transport system permease protein